MKRLSILLAAVFMLMTLSSCATNSKTQVEPVNSDDALLVGRLILDIRNYYVNGKHKKGIKLVVIDMDSHEDFTLYTDKNGLFFMPAVPGHNYRLFSLFYERPNGDGSWVSENLFYDLDQEIKPGAVNIVCDMLVEMDYENSFFSTEEDKYNEIKAAFERNYSGSKWLKYQMN